MSAPARVLVLQCGARPGPPTCRSLTRAGHAVIGAHDGRSGGATGASGAVRRPLRSPSPEDDPGAYAGWLEEIVAALEVDVVMPVTEGLTHLLADRYDGAVGPAVVAGPGRAAYRALCNKDGLAATARAAGVAVPAGVVVRAGAPHDPLPAPPCVVKPVSSATPRAAGVVYHAAAVAADAAERDRLVADSVAATGAAIVQPLVRGRRWRLHFACGPGGFASIAWLTVTSSPRATGMSSVSRMAPVPPALGAAGARLAAAGGYRGIGSLQFFETGEGPVVHDANLRSVYTVGGSVRAGLDMPALAVAIARGEPEPGPLRVRPGRYVSLIGEARGVVEDLRGGRPAGAARGTLAMAAAALSPRGMLDPSDPRAIADIVRAARRRRSRGDRPAAGPR